MCLESIKIASDIQNGGHELIAPHVNVEFEEKNVCDSLRRVALCNIKWQVKTWDYLLRTYYRDVKLAIPNFYSASADISFANLHKVTDWVPV